MSKQVLEEFSKLNIQITDKHIEEIESIVIAFELRQNAPLALNSPLLGVHKIYFIDSDISAIFSMFGINEKIITNVIKKIPFIIPTRHVSSDEFNVFTFWLLHLGRSQIQDVDKRYTFMFNLAKYIHYKFFTSLVNHSFPHGAPEKIMTATINSLTRKYDIIVYGTWRKTIEARCKDLIDENEGLHRETFLTANDDKGFIYAVTDTQTRLRDKINLIVTAFYQMREQGAEITSRSSTTIIDGEKVLIDQVSVFDTTISTLCSEILSVNLFLDRSMVQLIAKQFTNISQDMLRGSLISMSELATIQAATGLLDRTEQQDGLPLYIGMRALMTNIIQKSYRYCIKQHVDISNKAQVFTRIKNVYSSSRIADPDIVSVKNSIAHLTTVLAKTKRATTMSSLRLAILLYVILKSFRHM
jgi:hypothetical protein